MNKRQGILVSVVFAMVLVLSACSAPSSSVGGANGGPVAPAPPGLPSQSNPPSEEPDECSAGVQGIIECIDDLADPLDTAEMGAAPPETGASPETYSYTVQEYIDYIITDLDQQWSSWFLASGFEEPYVFQMVIAPGDQPFVSACKYEDGTQLVVGDDFPNAFYCSADVYTDPTGVVYEGSIILPVTTMQKMWTGDVLGSPSTVLGDFAAAIIMAHEFGHHIQDELRIQYAEYSGSDLGAPTGKNGELIADCFAGNWTASAYYTGLLEAGDFEEAVAALEAIARTPSESHGTSAERVQAMLDGYHGVTGYTAGDPMGCVDKYWY